MCFCHDGLQIDANELNDNLEDCSEKEQKTLQDWVSDLGIVAAAKSFLVEW